MHDLQQRLYTAGSAAAGGREGGKVERRKGGEVERWRGGEVERWRGGEVERWSREGILSSGF